MSTLNQTKFLSVNELNVLEALLLRNITLEPRNCLMLLVAMKTGARASELLAIKKADLIVNASSVMIRGIKGSYDREIPISKSLFNQLVKYTKQFNDEDLLFPISYERLVQLWHLYRPSKKKFHALRHSIAITVYKKTRNLHLVKTVLGHKSITNTQIYLDYVETQLELRKALSL